MNNFAQNQYHSLMEAYYAVYDEDIRNKLSEEKEIKEFLEVIDFLIEDGYDLSEYTYEELYEFHINETLLGGAARGIGTLLKKSGGKIYQGAKEPAKKVLTKLGKLAVPTAIAAGLVRYCATRTSESLNLAGGGPVSGLSSGTECASKGDGIS